MKKEPNKDLEKKSYVTVNNTGENNNENTANNPTNNIEKVNNAGLLEKVNDHGNIKKLSKLQKTTLKHLKTFYDKKKIEREKFYDHLREYKEVFNHHKRYRSDDGMKVTELSYKVARDTKGKNIWNKEKALDSIIKKENKTIELFKQGKLSKEEVDDIFETTKFYFTFINRHKKKENLTNKFVSSFSRSLKRLEKRGLIKRLQGDIDTIVTIPKPSLFLIRYSEISGVPLSLLYNPEKEKGICPMCDVKLGYDGYCSKCNKTYRWVTRKRTTSLRLTKEGKKVCKILFKN